MGEELRQQESKIGALEEKTDRTQDNLASLSTNARKDFRLRGKCATVLDTAECRRPVQGRIQC